MEHVDVSKLITEIYKMTLYGEPNDFHDMDVSDISFVVKVPTPSFRAEDVLRECKMNICRVCSTDLAISVAIGEEDYFLKRNKCKL